MGTIASCLVFEAEQKNGEARPLWAQFLDPIGACIYPAEWKKYRPDKEEAPQAVVELDSENVDSTLDPEVMDTATDNIIEDSVDEIQKA